MNLHTLNQAGTVMHAALAQYGQFESQLAKYRVQASVLGGLQDTEQLAACNGAIAGIQQMLAQAEKLCLMVTGTASMDAAKAHVEHFGIKLDNAVNFRQQLTALQAQHETLATLGQLTDEQRAGLTKQIDDAKHEAEVTTTLAERLVSEVPTDVATGVPQLADAKPVIFSGLKLVK